MKKKLIVILIFLNLAIYNIFANSSSINSRIIPFIQENLDNMILVENFKSDEKKYNFKIGKYEVTQELYEVIMGKNPSYYSKNPMNGENQKRRPVEFISWYDAINFCNQLTILIMGEEECCYNLSNIIYKTDDEEAANEKFIKEQPTYVLFIKSADVSINHNKKGFRLPTREEWLFAAKGGTKSQNFKYSGSNNLSEVAWYYNNSSKTHHEVGLLKPNELGLYDMNGNVEEFCEDLTFYVNTKHEIFPRRISCGGSFFAKEEKSLLTYYEESLESPGNGGQGFRIICIDSAE